MKHFLPSFGIVVGGLIGGGIAKATEAEKSRIRVVDADQVEVSWIGIENKTYFMEWSTDLFEWNYMPMISSGAGSPLAFGFESDSDKFFTRLRVPNQQVLDPKGADFDEDGLSNWQEVSKYGTNPFEKDSNGDGYPDGQTDTDLDGISDQWEAMLVLQLENPSITGIADINASTDSDGDGVSDFLEYQLGLSGHKVDSDGDGYSDFLSINQKLVLGLNELSGSVANDTSIEANDGTLIDVPSWLVNSGVSGGCLELLGGADAVSIPSVVVNGQINISVSLWFKASSQAGVQSLLSGASVSQPSEFGIQLEQTTTAADTVRVYGGAGTSFTWAKDRSLADGLWHHLVLVRDAGSSSMTLYLDGAMESSQSFPTQPIALQLDSLTLGQQHATVSSFNPSAVFVGKLDEVRVYSTAFTSEEVSELFQPNDLDADGLPDDYELQQVGNLSTLVGADDDADGDGATNREEFDAGSDPLDFYNGQTPVLVLVSGDTQTIYNGQRTPAPLVFKVTVDGSTPLIGAPITVAHLGLMGSVQTLDGKTLSSSLTILSDTNGEVAVYFKAD